MDTLDAHIKSFITTLNIELANVNQCIAEFEECRDRAEGRGSYRTASIFDGFITQAENDRKKIVRILTCLDFYQN